ncbi:haloacid dehalogenase-like hydrolase [Butyrivibrio sp. NC3005]|uniref:haloacid dehalogenase-like hydrolase n=1 Tax=Butyrivibrio sp. NC3005 TaxID=1280685 RepID=UPI0004234D29|nr:haloacid dehalogenase-like hydrolase [Butyrivibrio sp. NC3005]
MANVIALIWDFDKTLVDGYMQDPIFAEYNVDSEEFWEKVNKLPDYYKEQGVLVNPDTIYLNHFIHCVKDGFFPGLTNEKLKELGSKIKFYNGLPDFFELTKKVIEEDKNYKKYDITVEHYIVSTGIRKMIEGSVIAKYTSGIWGCDFIEGEDSKDSSKKVISEIGFTIDNTTKTRALFEINKGVGKWDKISVNTKLAKEKRRVPFENMIYIADGPSDVPAFSVIKQNKGATLAVYAPGSMEGMKQAEHLREDGRVDMITEADYSENKMAYMWIVNKMREYADRICEIEAHKLSGNELPKHLK